MNKIFLTLISCLLLSACSLNINVNQDPNTVLPSPTTQSTTAPTVVIESIESQLSTFFSNKFSKNPADVKLSVSQNTGTHASGGISFAGEMGGGMWLAHLDNGAWIVDYDGNGTIPCQNIEPFSYPTSILSECWNEATQSIKHF